MKKIIILLAILLCLSLPQHAVAELSFAETKKLAEQGDATAQFRLGDRYVAGQGVSQDYKKAFYWFQKAAEQGLTVSQYNLGVMYRDGQGVIENYKQALYWFQKAAEQNLSAAQYNLGYIHEYGQGVIENYKKAIYYYQKAAEQGHAEAQYNLGAMYYNGKGVMENNNKAYALMLMAQANRHDSLKAIKVLKSYMTSAQIAQAQNRASRCYDSDYKNCGDLFQ